MRRDIRLLLVPLAMMASATVIGWHFGAPQTPKLAAAVPAARIVVMPPAPEARVVEDPAMPVGLVSESDIPPPGTGEPLQFAALTEEQASFGTAPMVTPAMNAGSEVTMVLPPLEPPPLLAEVPPPSEPPAGVAPAKGPALHLASYRGPRRARYGWTVLTGNAGRLLADALPELREVDVRGERIIRLVARLPAGVDGAVRCAKLRRAGFYCASADSSQPAKSARAR